MTIKLVGYDDDATPSGTGGANYVSICRFQAEASGSLTEFYVRVGASDITVKYAIYSDAAGPLPGTRLLSGESGTLTASGFRVISVGSPINIASGTYYWLALNTAAANGFGYNLASGVRRYKSLAYTTDIGTMYPETWSDDGYADDDTAIIEAGWGDISLVQKSLTGTLTPSGAIGIKTKVTRAGTLDLAGAVIAKFFHTLAGTLNLTGAISAVYRQIASLAGTLTPSGELNRKISKAVSGTLNLSGVVSTVKKIYVSLAGTLNLTGAVLLKILISLIGSLGLSGVLSKIWKLVGAGSVSLDSTSPMNFLHVSKFTAEFTGVVTEIRVNSSASGYVKVAIYSDNGGEPDVLLHSVNGSTPVVAGWNTIPIADTPVNVGTDYWLAFNSGAA